MPVPHAHRAKVCPRSDRTIGHMPWTRRRWAPRAGMPGSCPAHDRSRALRDQGRRVHGRRTLASTAAGRPGPVPARPAAEVHAERADMTRHLITQMSADRERAPADGGPTPRAPWQRRPAASSTRSSPCGRRRSRGTGDRGAVARHPLTGRSPALARRSVSGPGPGADIAPRPGQGRQPCWRLWNGYPAVASGLAAA